METRRRNLAAAASTLPPEELAAAVETEAHRRMGAFLDGLARYRVHPYRRNLTDPPVVWREGSSRLLDYGISASRPILLVPSLINQSYILDLSEQCSLLRWLAGQGFRPLLLDWGAPGEQERTFTLTEYIAGRLERVLDTVLEISNGQPVPVIGYCMGGMLALVLAQRRSRDVAALVLLATPWDFHADPVNATRTAAALPFLEPALSALGELPVDTLQALFAALDPMLAARKFARFATLDPAGEAAEHFVALEDWLNDGIPLTAPVTRECLYDWYGQNTPAKGEWRIAGEAIEPGRISLPALCVLPARDRIVPPLSALALANSLPNRTSLQTSLGHVSMIAGSRAKEDVWAPLAAWLKSIA